MKGVALKPHRYKDGCFKVSFNSNKDSDAIRVSDEQELPSYVSKGYGIRMSGPGVAPSIYTAKNLIIG